MSISVQCPSCDMRRKVNERLAGRTIRCPGCDQPLTIPTVVEAEPLEPSQSEMSEVELPEQGVLEHVASGDSVIVEAMPVSAAEQTPVAVLSESGPDANGGHSPVARLSRITPSTRRRPSCTMTMTTRSPHERNATTVSST